MTSPRLLASRAFVACSLLFACAAAGPSVALAVPPAPTITGSDPASPGNDLRPEIKGTAQAGSTVTLYSGAGCNGAFVAQGTAAAFLSPGFTAAVTSGSTTTFYARAADNGGVGDCSTGFTYVEDPAPPPAPTVVDTVPASPSTDNTPEVRGTAAEGMTVRLYTNAGCTGELAGVGTAAQFASPGITVQVGDNTTTFFYAQAFDGVLASACSTTFVLYTHQLPKPAPPVFSDTDPDSPANANIPYVKGTAVAGGIVRLYANPACTEPRASEGTSASFASPGIQTSVLNDATTTLYATVTNAQGTTSDCSTSSLTYFEDSTAPETTIGSGPESPVPAAASVRFEFSASEPGSRFECHLHDPGFQPCTSPATFPARPAGSSATTAQLQVRAIDRAGNEDASPAARGYTIAGATVTPPPPPPPAAVAPLLTGCTLRIVAISGTPANDTIDGTARSDILLGKAGNDLLSGLAGNDCLYGEAGDDRLRGGSGSDRLFGGPGADRLEGESGNDRMVGAAGNDRLTDRVGRDSFSGGAGNDTINARDTSLSGRRLRDTVTCGAGTRDVALVDRHDAVLRDCERISRR